MSVLPPPDSPLATSYLSSPRSKHHQSQVKVPQQWSSPGPVSEDFLRDIPKTDLHGDIYEVYHC